VKVAVTIDVFDTLQVAPLEEAHPLQPPKSNPSFGAAVSVA
jgi:hypothetical protein